jgi:hypothetical protein
MDFRLTEDVSAEEVMQKLNDSLSLKTAPWPPWAISIQTHKVLGLK